MAHKPQADGCRQLERISKCKHVGLHIFSLRYELPRSWFPNWKRVLEIVETFGDN